MKPVLHLLLRVLHVVAGVGVVSAMLPAVGLAAHAPGVGPASRGVRDPAAVTSAPATYHVVGNRIVTASGSTFTVAGVDRPSLEWSCAGQPVSGSGSGIPASDFATMRADGANAVRIALNEDSWLSSSDRMPVAQPCPAYVATVEADVRTARAAGLVVILDLHWSDADQPLSPAAQQCSPDRDSTTFWREVASAESGDGGVWFELYNEPHDVAAAQWRNGGTVSCSGRSYTAVGMQTLVDTVRGTGAMNIVLAGGLDWAYDLSGVLADPLTGTNLAYATHPYEFKGPESGWMSAFGAAAQTVPVVATEFGRTDCAASSAYDSDVLQFFRSYGIGFTAWAWFSGGCGFPSLLSGTALTPVGALTMAVERSITQPSSTPAAAPSSAPGRRMPINRTLARSGG